MHARKPRNFISRLLRLPAALTAALLWLSACTHLPGYIKPVDNFELDRYLGTWYEIARLDHIFERGLEQVTARYERRDDGGVRVINRGYDNTAQQWKTAEGKAYFVGDQNEGHLKVSFFGPFYGSYVVFELDRDYQYAFVTGYSKNYLWLLSRSAKVSPELLAEFKRKANSLGFATDQLIMVKQASAPSN